MEELKYIAPYLPYGLKVKDIKYGLLFEALSFITSPNQSFDVYNSNLDQLIKDELLKPILRLLTDLTKEIEHEGEKFVPVDKLRWITDTSKTYNWNAIDQSAVKYLNYEVIQMLFEWHFDIFGLIEKGLAVDINTLSE